MVLEWFKVEEMGHGIFVPLVAGYVIWKDRDRILGQPIEPSWWGAALVIWGGIQLVLGTVGADFFLARTAFLFTMVGMLWMAAGWKIVRALAFPLLLLLFMIRMPLFIYSQITLPLQLFASQAAASALTLLGIPVVREGNVLELASQRLSVVEACSGIRSLLSLSFLSLIYAYFFDHKVWMRFVLLAASIPIAILANASRITLTGLVSEYKKEFAEGTYHTFEGWVIFMVALIILIITHQVINRIHSLIHGQK
jgi:exosortase